MGQSLTDKNLAKLRALKMRMEVHEKEKERRENMSPEQRAKEVQRTKRALYGAKT